MEGFVENLKIRIGIENELLTINSQGFMVPAADLIVRDIIDDIVNKRIDISVLKKLIYGIQWEPHPAQLEVVTQPLNYLLVEKTMKIIRSYLGEVAGRKNLMIYAGSVHPIQSNPFPINGTHISISAVPKRRKYMPRKFLVYVHNNIRHYLPELIALTANSPIMSGEYSGYASTRLLYSRVLRPSRYAVIRRSKATIIPREKRATLKYAFIFTRNKRYEHKVVADRVGIRLLDITPRGPYTNIIEDYGSGPESSRVEIRFIDNPSTIDYLVDITYILLGIALEAIDHLRRGLKIADRKFLDENRIRAIKDGINASFIADDGEEAPAREYVIRMLENIEPYLDMLGVKLRTSLRRGIPEIEKFGKPKIETDHAELHRYLRQGKIFLKIRLSSNRSLITFSGTKESIKNRDLFGLVFPQYKLEWISFERNVVSTFQKIHISYWMLTNRGYIKIHPDDTVVSAITPIGVLTKIFSDIHKNLVG